MESSDQYQYKRKEVFKKSEAKFKECPSCHYENDSEAIFCAECGYQLESKKCHKCGSLVRASNADFCEHCGEWLIGNKCKFCYAELETDAKYCSECGNPVEGITCPKCGELNHFDFCKKCNHPLTSNAYKMMETIKQGIHLEQFKNNQEARTFFNAQRYLLEQSKTEVLNPLESDEKKKYREELLKMKEYLQKAKEEQKIYKPLFTEDQVEKIKKSGLEAEKEIRRKKQEANHIIGWKCYAFGNIHRGPHECILPQAGGEWIYEKNS